MRPELQPTRLLTDTIRDGIVPLRIQAAVVEPVDLFERGELVDRARSAVDAFRGQVPDASFDEGVHRCFRNGGHVFSGRCSSSRVIESAGTRTAQVQLERDYGGSLLPDVNHLATRSDARSSAKLAGWVTSR